MSNRIEKDHKSSNIANTYKNIGKPMKPSTIPYICMKYIAGNGRQEI